MQKFLNKKRKLGKKGFTLIELIVVIAIIGILVLLAAPKFLGYTKDANVAAMKADAKVLSNAALMFNIDTETWPQAVTVDVGVDGIEGTADDVVTVNAAVDVTGTALETAIPGVVAYALNADALSEDYVKNTANDISEYVLVVDGDFEGEVFHINGVEDSKQVTWVGVDK